VASANQPKVKPGPSSQPPKKPTATQAQTSSKLVLWIAGGVVVFLGVVGLVIALVVSSKSNSTSGQPVAEPQPPKKPGPEKPGPAEKQDPVIAPEAARDHIGERCVVQMRVRSSRLVSQGRRLVLNSEEDYKSPANCAVWMDLATAEAFRGKGILVPERDFKGRTIRISGRIKPGKEGPEIEVEDANQITVVEP
jgi:hypothetical protein